MQSSQQWHTRTGKSPPRQAARFLLHWLVKMLVLGFLLVRRHRAIAAIVLLGGAALWWAGSGSAQLALYPQVAESGARSLEQFSASVPSAAPVPAVEQYLRAQSRYDARGMWEAVSDETKSSATARNGGMTLQRVEQQLEEAKSRGIRYDQAKYVGGYLAQDGRGFYLYVITVSADGGTQHVPYTFTVNKQGKILDID